MTDEWLAYRNLSQIGFNHLTVNHSLNFIDPLTWANTQRIESNWNAMKKKVCRGGIRREDLDLHLCEYLWRREVKRSGRDAFEANIRDIAHIYPI